MLKLIRRRLGQLALLLAVSIVVSVAATVSIPMYMVSPGNVRDTAEAVMIPSAVDSADGSLLLTTISLRPTTPVTALLSMFDRHSTLRPARELLPGDMDWDEYIRRSERMMAESKASAQVAALTWLGYEARMLGTGARIVEVMPNSPADGQLQNGDVVVAVFGQPVEFADDMLRAFSQIEPGSEVTITVNRDGELLDLTVGTVEHPQIPGQAALLVAIETAGFDAEIPLEIEIRADGIAGPSAGLMFALQIIEQLDPTDLTAGRTIAGTGSIDARGRVGEVGGVPQKVVAAERAGATVFLVPAGNEREARRVATKVSVLAVSTLQEAIDALSAVD